MDCSAVVFDISRNASGQFDLCKRSLEESFSFSAERNEIKTFIGEWRTEVGLLRELVRRYKSRCSMQQYTAH